MVKAHAGWGAAVWSADDRGLGAGVAFATARGFLGNEYSNNQAEYIAPFECLSRALGLQDPNVIFEVDSLLLAKQLARHLPWACRSEISLHFISSVFMFVTLSHLFTYRGIFGISTVSSIRPQMPCLTRRLMSVIRMVLRNFGNVRTAHPVCLFRFFSLVHPSLCLFSDVLSSARCIACVRFTLYLSFRLSQKKKRCEIAPSTLLHSARLSRSPLKNQQIVQASWLKAFSGLRERETAPSCSR